MSQFNWDQLEDAPATESAGFNWDEHPDAPIQEPKVEDTSHDFVPFVKRAAQGLGHAIAHPIDTMDAVGGGLVKAFDLTQPEPSPESVMKVGNSITAGMTGGLAGTAMMGGESLRGSLADGNSIGDALKDARNNAVLMGAAEGAPLVAKAGSNAVKTGVEAAKGAVSKVVEPASTLYRGFKSGAKEAADLPGKVGMIVETLEGIKGALKEAKTTQAAAVEMKTMANQARKIIKPLELGDIQVVGNGKKLI